MKNILNKITKAIPEQTKANLIRGAVAGLAIAALLPSKKDEDYMTKIEIEDLGEAKKIISSITAASEYQTGRYLKGEISSDMLAENIDDSIRELSNGLLENQLEFKVYVDYYNELMTEI